MIVWCKTVQTQTKILASVFTVNVILKTLSLEICTSEKDSCSLFLKFKIYVRVL